MSSSHIHQDCQNWTKPCANKVYCGHLLTKEEFLMAVHIGINTVTFAREKVKGDYYYCNIDCLNRMCKEVEKIERA